MWIQLPKSLKMIKIKYYNMKTKNNQRFDYFSYLFVFKSCLCFDIFIKFDIFSYKELIFIIFLDYFIIIFLVRTFKIKKLIILKQAK